MGISLNIPIGDIMEHTKWEYHGTYQMGISCNIPNGNIMELTNWEYHGTYQLGIAWNKQMGISNIAYLILFPLRTSVFKLVTPTNVPEYIRVTFVPYMLIVSSLFGLWGFEFAIFLLDYISSKYEKLALR